MNSKEFRFKKILGIESKEVRRVSAEIKAVGRGNFRREQTFHIPRGGEARFLTLIIITVSGKEKEVLCCWTRAQVCTFVGAIDDNRWSAMTNAGQNATASRTCVHL